MKNLYVGDVVAVNSKNDIMCDADIKPFVGETCAIVNKLKSGLYHIVLCADTNKSCYIPKANLDLLEIRSS